MTLYGPMGLNILGLAVEGLWVILEDDAEISFHSGSRGDHPHRSSDERWPHRSRSFNFHFRLRSERHLLSSDCHVLQILLPVCFSSSLSFLTRQTLALFVSFFFSFSCVMFGHRNQSINQSITVLMRCFCQWIVNFITSDSPLSEKWIWDIRVLDSDDFGQN